MINSAIRLNKSCPCVLEWFICISVLLLTRGYSLWHLSLLFSTLKLDSRALVEVMPPTPTPPFPYPSHSFFLVFTGTGFWQTLCRPACCLKRTHLLPQSCHCCCSDALRKNVSCWVGERIALVAGDTLSLTLLDGHEFSRDQKLHPPKPTPPQTCLVVKTMQCNSPWTCFLSKSIRSFQFPFSHYSLTQKFPWRLRKSRCWLCTLYFMALLH